MSDQKTAAYRAARLSQIGGWVIFLILLGLTMRGYLWGQFAMLAGAIAIANYYIRFATPPEDIADAKDGVVLLGLLLVTLLASDINQRGHRAQLFESLEDLCTNVPDGDKQWEKCDELLGLIHSEEDASIDDWVEGT